MSLIGNQVVDRCTSTNDLARKLGESGVPHGTWISARMQEGGRGRLGREWRSLDGNLFLSMVARIERRDVWTWVPLAAAVAVVEALRDISGAACSLKIKWPNDIWLDGAKAGGILCEGVGNSSGAFIVIGIGLNCAVAPAALDQPTASLGVGVDVIRPLIVAGLRAVLAELESSGPSSVARRYEAAAALASGIVVHWKSDDGVRTGVVERLGPSGELIVNQEGREVSLFAEDVSIRAAPTTSDGSPA